ncbi:Di-heme cytochrome c peroxidase [Desulfosarcina cetonica]|uniref:cytochrome c peroxidase n=1 Tax=Desulfosarcina cetonica TaxID=90730 RepID=UPI0006CFB4B6|nr:cytochrome c peroxidase [Desulfosarcina cetonica]VTR67252.1 Di-heme cytochrome c peroxidase [Desulfosarcina cetonica]
MKTVKGRLVYLAIMMLPLVLAAIGCQSVQKGPLERSEGESATAMPQKTVLKAEPGTPDGILLMQARYLIGELPDRMPGSENDTPAKVALGKKLYFEEAISINKTQSCNDCHPIDNKGAGADNEKTGLGALGKNGPRNDPSTLNAGFQIAQFWDGRSPDLADQAKGPVLNPIEMGMPAPTEVIDRLKAAGYVNDFKNAFPDQENSLTYDNFGEAVAAFERTLISRARIDRFIKGEADALTDREKEGMRIFMDVGCIQCHSGPVLGGMMFQKIGIFDAYANEADKGRYEVTKNENDLYVFKVPMLRNATLTAPYFHDGGVETIAEAVDLMGTLQLNRQLTNAQNDRLIRFLTALADDTRTQAPLPDAIKAVNGPTPPDMATIANDEQGKRVKYGYALVTDTFRLLGGKAGDTGQYAVGNNLACTNCHQEEGTKIYGFSWVGVSTAYPKYRGREDKVQGLRKRINGCFQRSMNGNPIPEDGKEMNAIVAYLDWLSAGTTKAEAVLGKSPFNPPHRMADREKGAMRYAEFCQSCHGSDGAGFAATSDSEKDAGAYLTPAVWGDGSYNNGAGANRLLTLAPFLQSNMPLGTGYLHPVLSTEDAYDVAAYVDSMPRPQMANLAKDYPKLIKKPVDCPYPPYADAFPQEQHQFGPFQPILAAKEKAMAK